MNGIHLAVLVAAALTGCSASPCGSETCVDASGSAGVDGADTAVDGAPAGEVDPAADAIAGKLLPSSFEFIGLQPGLDATWCFKLVNAGAKPLVVAKVALVPDNPEFQLVEVPALGSTLPPHGAPGNLDGSASLQSCVRYQPNAPAGKDEVELEFQFAGTPANLTALIVGKPL